MLKKRTGGVGSILETLFHIVDTECSWIRGLKSERDLQEKFSDFTTLSKVRELDGRLRPAVEEFVDSWDTSMENRELVFTEEDGTQVSDKWSEVMRHLIAHEIHHIGQLSVWSRELGKEPVSANLVGRGLGDL